MTDMPLPCQSSISAAARSSTGSGKTAGPGLKLNARIRILAIEAGKPDIVAARETATPGRRDPAGGGRQ
jgi:hypothetical protein